MPDLKSTLQENDLDFLKMVSEAWGITLPAPDFRHVLEDLSLHLLTTHTIQEGIAEFPALALQALQDIIQNGGRMNWGVFSRRYGEVRLHGAAWRDRERPHLHPANTAEYLWYHALVGKTFFNMPPEPQECAYIPDDLLRFLPVLPQVETAPLGRPAKPEEIAYPSPVNDLLIDQACTLLAALRTGYPVQKLHEESWLLTPAELCELLENAGLIDERHTPRSESVREFLEASRSKALAVLTKAWLQSTTYDDLRHLPGLRFEGDLRNIPLRTRLGIIEIIKLIPTKTWWNLKSFIAAVQERHPDIQRAGGDYDAWLIYRLSDGKMINGFEHWGLVEGALLHYFIEKILHALGILDVARDAPHHAIAAFRLSDWAETLLSGEAPDGFPAEDAALKVYSDGKIIIPPLFPRPQRYQIARFCFWAGSKNQEYVYRITTDSLESAHKQGLRPLQLLALLRRHHESPLPPNLIKALERWEAYGTQVDLKQVFLLQVTNPEVIQMLQESRAKRFIGERLNPNTLVVRPGGVKIVNEVLIEIGYFSHMDEAGITEEATPPWESP